MFAELSPLVVDKVSLGYYLRVEKLGQSRQDIMRRGESDKVGPDVLIDGEEADHECKLIMNHPLFIR